VELGRHEAHVRGLEGLHVPQAGVVDFTRVCEALGRQVGWAGGTLRTGFRVRRVQRHPQELVLQSADQEVRARNLVNCAGLQSDRVARLCGVEPQVRIVPFRGSYFQLARGREDLVRGLIYPVPDPRFPFLGVHLTRTVDGDVIAGPNALLALSRDGYGRVSVSPKDVSVMLGYGGFWRMGVRWWRTGLAETGGFWRMGVRWWRTGLAETVRSMSKRGFVHALRRLIPEIRASDLERGPVGIRAQAVSPDGALVDDFCIQHGDRTLHVLNAPSPAATASLSIGASIAEMAEERFGLSRRSSGTPS
jgi:L-2-hydroxyglutarate oxidase